MSAARLALLLAFIPLALSAQVRITEFMASNMRALRDDFGQYEDWIELHNFSPAPVNLEGWTLTDSSENPAKWRFPPTNLPPDSFLVVFASARDRQIPGRPLHANFKLEAAGEFLALARPDGSIAAQFEYPPQSPDVSYGFSLKSSGTLLVATNSMGRVLVPLDASLSNTWTSADYDDSAWRLATNGIGFETGESDDPATLPAVLLADNPPGYWGLNETGGAMAVNAGRLGNQSSGQFLDGVVLGVAGPRPPDFSGFEFGNQAARFHGAGARVEVPYSPELNPGEAFTVEAWVKPSRSGASPAWIVSSLNVNGGRNGYALAQDYSARNQWEFRLGNSQGYIARAFGGRIDTNRWQYLTGVFDGATARLYVDGAQVASVTLSRPFEPNPSQKLVIGGRINPANPYYFAGDIDEVAVTARALPAADIAARFQMGKQGGAPDHRFHYTGLIATPLESEMFHRNGSAYLRLPFMLTNAADLSRLTLRVRYDDGFAAYLNGRPVASDQAPSPLAWNSAATERHSSASALRFQEFDLSAALGDLRDGTNLLALHGLNHFAANPDFLLLAELEATSAGAWQSQSRYFLWPTPGGINGTGSKDLGPIITAADHQPKTPGTNDNLTVTCRIEPAFAPVAKVTLHWRVMFDSLQQIPMFDDAGHGDGGAGDGVYGAIIPSRTGLNSTYTAGQMVRWYITAVDSLSRTSRWPLFESSNDSAEYLGTVVQPNYVTSQLPVFHLFAPPEVLQPGPATQRIGADSEQGGRVSLFYDDEFYDNIHMELRGNTSAGLNKKAHRLEFNRHHPFRHPGLGGRVRKTSLLAEMLDPTYLRQHLCFWLLESMGVPSPFNYPVCLQLNGAFYQLAFHSDVLGEEQLERMGYDPSGALYKAVGQVNPQFSSTGGFQKLLPKTNLTDRADYLQLANGINEERPLETRRAAVFDLFDVPQVINYLAGARFCAENDDVWANMSLYRDTYGDRLWRIIPFDMNASWGQLYGEGSVLEATNDFRKSHPFYGGSQIREHGGAPWNRIYDVIIALPETREMLLRRQRTLLDTLVLPPGTPSGQLILEHYIQQMTNRIGTEALLDRQKWGYSPWAPGKRFPNGVSDLLNQFVKPRRTHWYVTHSLTNTARSLGLAFNNKAGIPLAQPPHVLISLHSWDSHPVSGHQDEEYLCLTNANSIAVDLSGWKLEGGIGHRFRPGTVLPSHGALYLTPNVSAFRARSTPPTGGQGLFVQGSYQGHLSEWGEVLTLTDANGRLVFSAAVGDIPPQAGPVVISEIMYRPPDLPNGMDNDQFEFVELQNITATNVPLYCTFTNEVGYGSSALTNTWRLRNAIDFDFPTNVVLAAGGRLLVVGFHPTNSAQLAFFRSVYSVPAEAAIVGPWDGKLDNSGETIELKSPGRPTIISNNLLVPYLLVDKVTYQDTPPWPVQADGLGGSLQRRNLAVHGLEATNWFAAPPTAGLSNTPRLSILSIERHGSEVSLAISSQAGRSYRLEYKDDLQAEEWTPISPAVAGTGHRLVLTEATAEARRFYRVRLEDPLMTIYDGVTR